MHTRRVGAFLIGAWLFGGVLIALFTSQDYANIDRFFSNPPVAISKELNEVGPEVMREILEFQASQNDRQISEMWLVGQLGLGCSLLAISIFTFHRSRVVIIASLLMTAIVVILYFWLTPRMNALARTLEFLPPTGHIQERANLSYYSVWYRVLDILKILMGALVATRLLLDRSGWQEKLLPSPASKSERHRRRSRSGSLSSDRSGPEASQTEH